MKSRDPELPRLPLEVIPNIFPFLTGEHSSLAAMALACSYFHNLAEQVLYTTFDSDILPVCEGFSRAMIERPRHAQMVKKYRIHEFFHDSSRQRIEKQREEWLELIGQGLRCMVNLKHLEFRTQSGAFVRKRNQLLKGCTFQLESLVWDTDEERTVRKFLERQRHLRELEVYFASLLERPSSKAFPNLFTLTTNKRTANALLPGRHIKHLEIRDHREGYRYPTDTEPQLTTHKSEMKQLLSFTIQTHISRLPVQLHLLSSLRYLQLSAIYDNEVNLVADLPELHTLVLSTGVFETGNSEQRTLEQQQDLVLRLSVALPALVRVDIGDLLSSMLIEERGYQRWIRCELQPGYLSYQDIQLDRMDWRAREVFNKLAL